jgi:DNA-binding LacI/PurR family transcriptional regulator
VTPPSSWKIVEGQKHIALVWAWGASYVDHEIEQGMSRALLTSDLYEIRCRLEAQDPGFEAQKTEVLKLILEEPAVVGVLAAFVDFDQSIVDELAKRGKPTVFIERPEPFRGEGCVRLDHHQGARLATEALVNAGRRRIAYLGAWHGKGWAGEQRHHAVRDLLASRGLPFEVETEETYDTNASAAATARLLDRIPEIDAIVFGSDLQAIGGMKILRERKIDVPKRIAVVGFDDSDSARRVMPRLSSVRQPFQDTGFMATEMLLKAINGDRRALRNVTLPQQVVLRGSVLDDPQAEKVVS